MRARVLGAGLAFAGAITVISRGDLHELLALRIDTGDAFALAAAGCWATFNLTSRLVVDRVPGVDGQSRGVLGRSGRDVRARSGRGTRSRSSRNATAPALAALVGMALLSSVVAGQLFLVGVRDAGVGRAVVFIYLVPVLTAVLSVLLLGEALSGAQLAGGAAVLLGLLLTTRGGPA